MTLGCINAPVTDTDVSKMQKNRKLYRHKGYNLSTAWIKHTQAPYYSVIQWFPWAYRQALRGQKCPFLDLDNQN